MFELKIEVENQEILDKTKAFILVANHQSSTDFIGKFYFQLVILST
jgi:1-acyl-sn-glycerol-3-phosphate acyltransferase